MAAKKTEAGRLKKLGEGADASLPLRKNATESFVCVQRKDQHFFYYDTSY